MVSDEVGTAADPIHPDAGEQLQDGVTTTASTTTTVAVDAGAERQTWSTLPVEPTPTMPVRDVAPPEFPDTLLGRIERLRYGDAIYNRVVPDPEADDDCIVFGRFLEAGYLFSLTRRADPDLQSIRVALEGAFAATKEWAATLPAGDVAPLVAAIARGDSLKPQRDAAATVEEFNSLTDGVVAENAAAMEPLVEQFRARCPSVNPL